MRLHRLPATRCWRRWRRRENGAAAPREWDDTEVVPPVGFRGGADAPGVKGASGLFDSDAVEGFSGGGILVGPEAGGLVGGDGNPVSGI